MKLEYHPSTAHDLNQAAAYYDEIRKELGAAFRIEVDQAIQRIVSAPQSYAVTDAGLRRCLIRRFPYSIVFRILDEDIVRILLIRHHRRNPALGLGRR